MKPYTPSPEMQFSICPELEAARKLPAWAAFHRACGRQRLFFDLPVRERKRGPFTAVAFTAKPSSASYELARGTGKTVIDAVADGFAKAGIAVPEAEPLLAQMRGVAADDFDDLMVDDFEEFL